MQWARLKSVQSRDWKPGRWRPVERTRVTNPDTDCVGGGVIMGATVVIYADDSERWYENFYDFDWNLEFTESDEDPNKKPYKDYLRGLEKALVLARQGHE